jgi:hypothetical protein
MTENLNDLFFETSNPDFPPGKKVIFFLKFAEIPGSS